VSKIGEKLVPALTVFQTPPEAATTYQVDLSRGSTAMSPTRPDETAGPIERSSSPANVPELNGSLVSGLSCAKARAGVARSGKARTRSRDRMVSSSAKRAAEATSPVRSGNVAGRGSYQRLARRSLAKERVRSRASEEEKEERRRRCGRVPTA